jgi:hypothetical protein
MTKRISTLRTDEIDQVNQALLVLDPAQLAALAEKISQVQDHPGFGKVYITIAKVKDAPKGRVARVGVEWEESLPTSNYRPE